MSKRHAYLSIFVGLGVTLAGCADESLEAPSEPNTTAAAELGSGCGDAMVVTAHPLATQAGLDVLAEGGNAVDAAIAVQLVLGLVEPQSSGLGGGAFVLHYNAGSKRLTTYDGRETAPAAAPPTLFLKPDGTPMDFLQAVRSGRSVGVPGVPRLLERLHRDHGQRPWKRLFGRATDLARNGFAISPRMNAQIGVAAFGLGLDPVARAYYLNPDGTPKPVGTILQNPAYADTLDALKTGGAQAFYTGPIAQDIVTAVQTDPFGPGSMTLADMTNYAVIKRNPVCGDYRGNLVCGMGPPSSGGIAVVQILEALERFDMRAAGPNTLRSVHLFSQAGRLAFADRNQYVADPAFVTVPTAGLLDPAYNASRSLLINEAADMGTAAPGTPPGVPAPAALDPSPPVLTGTSHISIRDREGNIVSMTTTIESTFGNLRMVRGFMLNNELTDFSFLPEVAGAPVANRVQGGKRPRSSMAPTIVLDRRGNVKYVTGSVGGASIIPTVAKTLIGMIDWQLTPQAAINLPHYYNMNGPTVLETFIPGVIGPDDVTTLIPALFGMGHLAGPTAITSGLATIEVGRNTLVGGVDPRREGTIGFAPGGSH